MRENIKPVYHCSNTMNALTRYLVGSLPTSRTKFYAPLLGKCSTLVDVLQQYSQYKSGEGLQILNNMEYLIIGIAVIAVIFFVYTYILKEKDTSVGIFDYNEPTDEVIVTSDFEEDTDKTISTEDTNA